MEYPLSPNGAGPLPYRFDGFLPALYQRPDCRFLHRFLAGLEPSWRGVESFLEDPSVPFDTRRAPAEFLPWLAGWIGLSLNQNWPERKQRVLLREAVDLYQMRGTREGIERFLEIYTGVRPLVVEPFVGSTLGPETVVGENAVIGDVPEHCFTVTVFVRSGEDVEESLVRDIVDMEKPAHTACDLRLVRFD